MTKEEIYREYVKVFALLVEDLGEERAYKNIEDSAERNSVVQQAVEQDAPFEMFVFFLISSLIQELSIENDKIAKRLESNGSELFNLCSNIWNTVLKKHTLAFARQRGLSFDEEMLPSMIELRDRGDDGDEEPLKP